MPELHGTTEFTGSLTIQNSRIKNGLSQILHTVPAATGYMLPGLNLMITAAAIPQIAPGYFLHAQQIWGHLLQVLKRLSRFGGDCVDEDYTTEGSVPAVGPNGEVYVAWSGPPHVNNFFKLYFDKSTDGGNTWLENDIVAGTQRGGWDYVVAGIYRSNGLPVTLCDISNSPYRGTIYINYTDSAGPADHDVMLIKSTNGGLNWSAPIRINDDAPGKEQFFTWMTIDQVTGHLYCVFMTGEIIQILKQMYTWPVLQTAEQHGLTKD